MPVTVKKWPVYCGYCQRPKFVIRWTRGDVSVWACLWHTRRAWRDLREEADK